MDQPILFIMCGLPGTFKSTTAKEIMVRLRKNNKTCFVVSGDDVRKMLNGGDYVYNAKFENMVNRIAKSIILQGFLDKHHIIYDEVNVSRREREFLIRLAYANQYVPVIVYCESDGKHLERRLDDPKGLEPEHWIKAIEELETEFIVPDSRKERCQVQVMKMGAPSKYVGLSPVYAEHFLGLKGS